MAVTNNGNRRRLNVGVILDKITQHGKTISDLAEANNYSEDEFIKELELGLGPQNFAKAMKANERNLKNQSRKTGNNRKTASGRSYKPATKVTFNKANGKGEDDMAKRTTEKARTKLSVKDMKEKLSGKEVQRDGAKALVDAAEAVLRVKQDAQKTAQKEFDAAEKKLKKANEAFEKASGDYSAKKASFEKIEGEVKALAFEIQQMESKIYLIAPNFKGTMPEYGKFVSTIEIPGMQVTIESGEVLLEVASLDNMMTCGYNALDEYFEALEFAKLCIAYETGRGEATILVDDAKLLKVLETQGIEV